ncbi:hypothetical protein NOK12_39490 [Nocardioides sp. OK12]|nr:hypothetical protein NOK12_39490 [Nocardioides sp. OK12]
MRAAKGVLPYGAEIWAEALRKEIYRKRIAAVHMGAPSESRAPTARSLSPQC